MYWVITVAHPKLLYCDAAISWSFIIPSLLQIMLSFILLGTCASDHLCPNISRLADFSGRDSSNLMPLLLSWCNSSPDVFSNFMIWMAPNSRAPNAASAVVLSIGEVTGACGIILCVVVGSIFTTMASVTLELTDVQRSNLLRDLGFVICAIGLLCYVCGKNEITLTNCTIMVFVYLVYLTSKFRSMDIDDVPLQPSMELEIPSTATQAFIGEESYKCRMNPSSISAKDVNNILTLLRSPQGTRRTAMASSMKPREMRDITIPGSTSAEYLEAFDRLPVRMVPVESQNTPTATMPQQEQSHIPEEFASNIIKVDNEGRSKPRSEFSQLLLPHFLDFREKSFLCGLLSLLTAPFDIILRLSCPQGFEILKYDEIKDQFIFPTTSLALLVMQSVICPLIFIVALSSILGHVLTMPYWVGAGVTTAGLIILLVQFCRVLIAYNKVSFLTPGEQECVFEDRRSVEKLGKAVTIVYILLGIVNAILWISLISNSVIEVFELYQNLTHISQSILGLTIFAWGNCIGDLVSNIAMCNLYRKLPSSNCAGSDKIAAKFFITSCASCIGGVMLNSMGGIGGSGFFAMLSGKVEWSVKLHQDGMFDYQLITSCVALMLQGVLLIIMFAHPRPMHEWFKQRMKPAGIFMCFIWGVATLINVLIEIV
ncbi:hypothetical protein BZL39_I00570 [Zygosaccharomyces parabailii]|nr:hypothetical protein BZL39_I00570 [Zygosaccharomyces parabailii]